MRRLAKRTEKVARKRLARLAGEWDAKNGAAYLRRVEFREWDGTPVVAWGLTDQGYQIAESMLKGLPMVGTRDTPAQVMALFRRNIPVGVAFGVVLVVIDKAPTEEMESTAVALCRVGLVESCAWTVNVKLPVDINF